ncbi:integrase [Pseudomonas sp. MH2]|uniref:Integrase n=1 Tax=Pseudomonas machongensis TaxID=3110229 RepID=A0ABU5VCT6_9PSED|nr:integrase [Pseudomonas sp. MH2]MEA5670529.1 integrase [Pseudomonas sp. MH2]
MRNRKASNKDLPPRMLRRVRKLKSGKLWVGYYYDGRDAEGKRQEVPLGTDLAEAKLEWARLEHRAKPKVMATMGELFDRYERDIIPGKSPRTQKDNRYELERLRKAFADAPIEAISPPVIAQYRDARSAKTRANREIALLSHVFTMAMEWGFAERNPCLAVRRNKEKVRDFYAADEIWDAVYAEGDQGLKDAMDLAYLAGQRPADTLKFSTVDLDEDYLWVDQNKTDKKLRIRRHVNGELTGLGLFIEALLERRKLQGVRNSRLITNDSGLRMSWEMLRNRFSEARDRAARKLTADGNTDLAIKVRQFQFRDIRPKAASEIEDISHASRLLGHSKEEITKRVYRRVGEVVSPTK